MTTMPNFEPFEPIPDPEPPLPHDHALKGHVEEPQDTFRPGFANINTERVKDVRFGDGVTGETHHIFNLEPDPEDPESMIGDHVLPDIEPRRVRLSRHIHESGPYKLVFIDHKKEATGVAAIAVTAGVVAVTSLVVRRRHKKD